MKIERGEKELKWTNLFSTYSIPITQDTEYIFSSKQKKIYVKNIVDGLLEVSVYNLKGVLEDKRTYRHYFVNFFEKDGFACIKYYDYSMQSYCTATFLGGAGFTGITRVNG